MSDPDGTGGLAGEYPSCRSVGFPLGRVAGWHEGGVPRSHGIGLQYVNDLVRYRRTIRGIEHEHLVTPAGATRV